MTYKVHEIKNYNYSYDAGSGGPGSLQLWSSQGKILDIRFIDDTSPVPPPVLAADLMSATASFRRSAAPGLIDMLRNESPVKVTINNQPPGFVFIQTGWEPAGEGEK